MNVDAPLVHIVEVVENQVTLGLVEANDSDRHCPVDPKRLPARCRMHPDEWMNSFDILGPGVGILSVQIRVG